MASPTSTQVSDAGTVTTLNNNRLWKQLQSIIQPLAGLIILTLIFLIFAPTYRSWGAIRDVLEQSTVLTIMATGTTISKPRKPTSRWRACLSR